MEYMNFQPFLSTFYHQADKSTFPLLPCKTANGDFFFNPLPSSKRPFWGGKIFQNLDLRYIVGLIFEVDSIGLDDRRSHWFSSQR